MSVVIINCMQPVMANEVLTMNRRIAIKLASSVVRLLSTSRTACASHYDVLEITPKATQGDIKSAYYKLSKVYHPDKSPDETSAKKFRAISEAYEVLGNIKLKKMYDKGLLVGKTNTSRMNYEPEPEPADPELRFYKSRGTRHVAPTMDGRTPIYDFDSWSKHHYGDIFKKSQHDRELLRKKREKKADAMKSSNQEAFLYMLFALGGLFVVLVVNGQADYDLDMTDKKRQKEVDDGGE